MKKNNILAIGAHPDDIEFSCGGTMAKKVTEGHRVYLMHITCSDCQNIEGKFIRKAGQSKQEAEDSAKVVGAQLIILGYEDQCVPFNREIIFEIENYLTKLNIDTIYTHSTIDSHQDHINTLRSVMAAARYIDNVFLYEQVALQRVGVVAPQVNYYEDITDYYLIKEKAMLMHKSQINEKYQDAILKGTRALAEYRGSQCNVKYAEAFNAIKIVNR